MAYQARADAPNGFTPEPHFRPAKPDTPLDNSGRTISAMRNKGQRGDQMRNPKSTLEKFPRVK